MITLKIFSAATKVQSPTTTKKILPFFPVPTSQTIMCMGATGLALVLLMKMNEISQKLDRLSHLQVHRVQGEIRKDAPKTTTSGIVSTYIVPAAGNLSTYIGPAVQAFCQLPKGIYMCVAGLFSNMTKHIGGEIDNFSQWLDSMDKKQIKCMEKKIEWLEKFEIKCLDKKIEWLIKYEKAMEQKYEKLGVQSEKVSNEELKSKFEQEYSDDFINMVKAWEPDFDGELVEVPDHPDENHIATRRIKENHIAASGIIECHIAARRDIIASHIAARKDIIASHLAARRDILANHIAARRGIIANHTAVKGGDSWPAVLINP